MTMKDVAELQQQLPNNLKAERLPNGLVRVFDCLTKTQTLFDAETGAHRGGFSGALDLYGLITEGY